MSLTDGLRRLLDERGVEYGIEDESAVTTTMWTTQNGGWAFDCHYSEFPREKPGTLGAIPELMIYGYSPEQAVAATLWRGTCKNKAPRYLDFLCSECGFVHYIDDANCTDDGNDWNYCPKCGKVVEQ